MTLLKAVNRIKRLSHRGDTTVTSDEITQQIIDGINDARRDVTRKIPRQWLQKEATPLSIVQATVTYSLASDLQEPIIFRYTYQNVEYIIKKVDSLREFYENIYVANSAQQKPRWYVEMGPDGSGYRQIQIFPPPDASYTVNYSYYIDPTKTDLTTSDLNSEMPNVPIYLHDSLWKGGLYYFYKSFDDPAQAVAKNDYEMAIQAIADSEDSDQDQELQFRYGNRTQWYDASTRFRQG